MAPVVRTEGDYLPKMLVANSGEVFDNFAIRAALQFHMTSRYVPTTFSDYHDYLVSVMLSAPDNFQSFDETPLDQAFALCEKFEVLQETFPLVEKKIKDAYLATILRELLVMANEFFNAGDDRNARYALQEFEGNVWPSRKVPARHAPDAERRAHGKVERYAGVVPNPYPYEGDLEGMGESQRRLYDCVMASYGNGTDTLAPGKEHNWLLGPDTIARKFSAKSNKAATLRFTNELSTGTSLAALRATNVYGSLLIFDVEEAGRARISVRGSPQSFIDGTPNFIVDEAQWNGELL